MPDNARPVSRLQAEVERELARGLDHFSIVTFGYDRSSDDPPPRLVIEWGHKQIAREKSRRKALGTIVIGQRDHSSRSCFVAITADACAVAQMSCFRAAWGTRWGAVAAVAGLVLAWSVLWLAGQLLVAAQPVAVSIQSVTVHDAPPGSVERSLRVEMESPAAGNCTRTSQHLLRQGTTYFPLGSALNGMGFSGSHLKFALVLSLPSGMPSGQYEYIQRSSYTCSWLAGFVQRRIAFQSLPVVVTVGLHSTSTGEP